MPEQAPAAASPPALLDQNEAPYLEAVLAYARRDPGRFHVPGHKGGEWVDPGLREAIGMAPLEIDIPAGMEGIDIGEDIAANPFQRAQRLAAEAWGARRSWLLVNGGSGGNHAICLTLAHMGPDVVVQRNVHSSTIDGMVLAGLRPHFASPVLDPELGVAHCLEPAVLDEALGASPDAAAALVVSPTYFGSVADIVALADVAHSHGVPLVVDEAWGSHMRFSPELPASALECGADLVLTSVHKIVGSITQSAVVHLGEGDRLDELVLDRAVTLVESTSPNALLTASLDAARRYAATRGEELLGSGLRSLASLRERIREVPGLEVLDESLAGRPGVHAYDPLRVVVDVRATGVTGHRIAELMHDFDDVNLEMFAENVVVAVFGLGEDAGRSGERLLAALRHAVERLGEAPGEAGARFAEPPPWGPTEMSPREAFLAPQEVVPFDRAEGRIATESLAAYPPGVPNVLPGERLTRGTLDYIADSIAHGGMVRGASDRSLRTVRVVIE